MFQGGVFVVTGVFVVAVLVAGIYPQGSAC